MEPSAIQIVTTIALMVAAGAVALVCDYLRNRSQQLRELALELDVRKEMTAVPSAGSPSAASIAAARVGRLSAAREEEKPVVDYSPAILHGEIQALSNAAQPERPERHSAEIVRPALASAAEMTSLRGNGRARRRAMPPPDVPLPKLDDMNPRQALSNWLDQRAAKAPARRPEQVNEAPATEARAIEAPVQPAEPALETLVIHEAIEAPAWAAEIEAAPEAQQEISIEPEAITELPFEESAVAAEPCVAECVPAAAPVPEPVAKTGCAREKDELRLIIRRALAKRSQQTLASNPQPVEETTAVAMVAPEPLYAPAVAAPVVEEEVPQASTPQIAEIEVAPVPVAEQPPRRLSVFLSTRKIDAPFEPVAPPSEASIAPAPAAPIPPPQETVVTHAAAPRFEVIEGAGNTGHSLEVALPAGLHDHVVLERALSTGKPFTGLVISVGVNDVEGRMSRNGDLMQSVTFFLRGLLEGTEFACRVNENEFLILCPGLDGRAAQSRLNRVAEQLWDYQLRGVSTWSLLFSWGSADVHMQRLPEAIAMATEQMCQTRRGRKMVSVDSLRPLQRAAI